MATLLDAGKSSPQIEAYVESQLAIARQRVRKLDWFLAILGLGVVSLAYLVLLLLIDRYFETPAGAGKFAWVGFGAVCLGYLYYAVLRPSRRDINPYYAAKLVETTIPDAKNSVINWLDLRDDERLPTNVKEMITGRANKDLKRADLDHAVRDRRTKWFIRTGAGLGLLAFILAMLPPTRTELKLLEPVEGNITIVSGNDLKIVASVRGRIPKPTDEDAVRLKLWYNPEDPENFELRHLQPVENDREKWEITVPAAQTRTGFFYQVLAANRQTETYQVIVKILPLFESYEVTYTPPAYLKLESETTDQANLTNFYGTKVVLTAKTNREVAQGHIEIEGQAGKIRGQVDPNQPKQIRFEFDLVHNDTGYRILFVTPEGDKNVDPPRFTMKLLDPKPRMVSFDLEFQYPKYLRWEDQKLTEILEPIIEAMRGTKVIITAQTNRPVRLATLTLASDKSQIQGKLVENEPLKVRFELPPLTEDTKASLQFLPDTAEGQSEPREIPIRVMSDLKPVVEITSPKEEEIKLPLNIPLSVDGFATDDHGIDTMRMKFQVVDPKVIELQAKPYREGKSFRREKDNSFPTRIDYKELVQLEKLKGEADPNFQLREGMLLEYWIEAKDNCDVVPGPNVGQSRRQRVRLLPPEKNDQKKQDQQQKQEQQKEQQKEHEKKQDQKNEEEKRDPNQPPPKAENKPQEKQDQQDKKDNPEQKKDQKQDGKSDEQPKDGKQDQPKDGKSDDMPKDGKQDPKQGKQDQPKDGKSDDMPKDGKQDPNQKKSEQKSGKNDQPMKSEDQPSEGKDSEAGPMPKESSSKDGAKKDQSNSDMKKEPGSKDQPQPKSNEKKGNDSEQAPMPRKEGEPQKKDSSATSNDQKRPQPKPDPKEQELEKKAQKALDELNKQEGKKEESEPKDGKKDQAGNKEMKKDPATPMDGKKDENDPENAKDGKKEPGKEEMKKDGKDAPTDSKSNDGKADGKKENDGKSEGSGEKKQMKGDKKEPGKNADKGNDATGEEKPEEGPMPRKEGEPKKKDGQGAKKDGATTGKDDGGMDEKKDGTPGAKKEMSKDGKGKEDASEAKDDGGKTPGKDKFDKEKMKELAKQLSDPKNQEAAKKQLEELAKDPAKLEEAKKKLEEMRKNATEEQKKDAEEAMKELQKEMEKLQKEKKDGESGKDGKKEMGKDGKSKDGTGNDSKEEMKKDGTSKDGKGNNAKTEMKKDGTPKDGTGEPEEAPMPRKEGEPEKKKDGKRPGKADGKSDEMKKDSPEKDADATPGKDGEPGKEEMPKEPNGDGKSDPKTPPKGNPKSNSKDNQPFGGNRKDPATNSVQPEPPEAADLKNKLKSGELLLDKFKNNVNNKEFMKDWSDQEKFEFLREYQQYLDKQRERLTEIEKAPANGGRSGASRLNTGPEQLKIESKQTGPDGMNRGRFIAPPGYGDAYKQFTEELSGVQKPKK
jgi:collagen type III alpha